MFYSWTQNSDKIPIVNLNILSILGFQLPANISASPVSVTGFDITTPVTQIHLTGEKTEYLLSKQIM